MKPKEATKKVKKLREATNDRELAKKLGMSRVTMYTRLEKNNWKKTEIALIETLK